MKCNKCNQEKDDYTIIKPIDETIKNMDEIICHDCLEDEIEIYRQMENTLPNELY